MTIYINANQVITREFHRPKTIGKSPCPRFMHSMDYFKDANALVICGGRNDQLPSEKILNDIWLLKLNNLEWQKVLIGGYHYVEPRFNFASVILGSKLIIAGGIGYDYKLLKDYQEFEMDQTIIKKKFVHKNKMEYLRNLSH